MPRDSRARLDAFVNELDTALGDQLVAVALFGEAVRRSYPDPHPPFNLLVLVHEARPAALRPLGAALAAWVKRGEPPPLFFAEREWRRAADVFPIEIEDMREAHELLRGSDPFSGLTTTIADLRQELEREVRGKLLQLRAEFAAVETNGKLLGRLVLSSAQTFFVLFRATLRAKGIRPPGPADQLIRALTSATGLDHAAFEWILDQLSGRRAASLQPFDAVAVAYVEAIERLAHVVDTMADEAPPDG